MPPDHPPEHVIERLEPLLTGRRTARMRAVLARRTAQVAFVFERMIDPHNLSAALRSLDAFGFQDVHLVQPGERLGLGLSRGITIGAERWLSLHVAPTQAESIGALQRGGYAVYASHLGEAATPLQHLDLARPTALVFGNEHAGVGEEVLALSDGTFRIDMLGFAQSLNLSVSVAISAFHARQALDTLAAQAGEPGRYNLPQERQRALYAEWLRQSVRNAEAVLAGEGGE